MSGSPRAVAQISSILLFVVLAVVAACGGPGAGAVDEGSNPRAAGEEGTSGDPGGTLEAPGGSPGSGGAAGAGLPCDVQDVLTRKCGNCHGAQPAFGASTPLVNHDDLTKTFNGKKVYELVAARIKDEARPMPPMPNPRLSPQESAPIASWVQAGAPRANQACEAPATGGPVVKPLPCAADTTVKARAPFVMAPNAPLDQYVCFGFDVTLTKKKHVTALAPKVDNKTILHHILLFQAPQAESPEPVSCAAFGSATWRLVAGWAPGGENTILPPEAGFPMEPGTTHWVMQLHYNNAKNLPGQQDNSGYDMCTTEQLRANDAGVLAFGSTSFTIPPRAKHAVTCDYTLPSTFQGVKFWSASPHMHTLGRSMSTHRLAGGNGTPEKVLDIQGFTFDNQLAYPVATTVAPGDVIRTRCGWENTTANQVRFGEGTGDEMCFDFIGYYPRIPDRSIFGLPVFTWVTPSQSARCSVTP